MRAVLLVCLVAGCAAVETPALEDGDLVFHRSRSAQAAVIAEVTGSSLTHVGLVFHRGGEPWVLEAVGPVRWTRFVAFRDRGSGIEVRRLRGGLDARRARAVRRRAESWVGRRYDARFEWSDGRMYCSELVWKAYARGAGIRLTEPERFGDLELGTSARLLASRRLGRLPAPSTRLVTPAALAASPLLEEVRE